MKLYTLWENSDEERYLLGVYSTPEKAMEACPGDWVRVEGVAYEWSRRAGRRNQRAKHFSIEAVVLDAIAH